MSLVRAPAVMVAGTTAEGAAALRAASARRRSKPGPDHLAERFVSAGPRLTAIVKVPLLRSIAPWVAERIVPGSYWFEHARVRHMDALLFDALEAGARQLVILGAGLDTRAHRLTHRLSGVPTFEVDHPLASAAKRDRVRRVFGALPARVRYVAVDLNSDGLQAALRAAGHREDVPSVVIWSGVTPYLRPRGVELVLGWMAANTAPGSGLIFDYVFREALEDGAFFYGAPQLRRRVAAGGEPLLFGIPRGSCAAFLHARGLQLVSDLGPEQLERLYLVRGKRLAGRPYGFVSIAHARVPRVAMRL